ncbi:MAG: hotdog domain-containing protein [Acidobacteriota bacterium]
MSQSFNRELGLRPGPEDATVLLDTRPEHQVMPGVIHFAVLATLAEVSAAQAAEASVVPSSVQLSLLTKAEPGQLLGRGRCLRRGRRLAVCEGEVFQGDRLVAKATVQFAVLG